MNDFPIFIDRKILRQSFSYLKSRIQENRLDVADVGSIPLPPSSFLRIRKTTR